MNRIPIGPISRETLVTFASHFDILVVMPAFETHKRSLRDRLHSKPLTSTTTTQNHTHYCDGVLYTTPDDYKAWIEALNERSDHGVGL